MSIRVLAIAVTLALALGAVPARAGSVTYDFVEAGTPGTVGATVTFASPPASPTTGWTSTSASDVLNLEISDPSLGQVGTYSITSYNYVGSSTGAYLDSGSFQAECDGSVGNFFFGAPPDGSQIETYFGGNGEWVLPTAVPEPSTFVLAGTAALAGLAARTLRNRRRTAAAATVA